MKANEFVKKFGIEKTSSELSVFQSSLTGHFGWAFVDELKRLVESHEIVGSHGGLENAKDNEDTANVFGLGRKRLKQAIADVESCK